MILDEEQLISKASNKDLIHKNKYCKTKARALISELKALVITSDRVKAELRMRLMDLEMECLLAEDDRQNSDDPFSSALLEFH